MKIDMKFDSFTTYTTHKQTIDENLPNNNLIKNSKETKFYVYQSNTLRMFLSETRSMKSKQIV